MRTMSCNSPITDPLWDKALRQWKLLSTLVGHHPFKDAPGDIVPYDTPPTLGPISGEGVLVRSLSLYVSPFFQEFSVYRLAYFYFHFYLPWNCVGKYQPLD
jgi:hypothetical protein